MQSELEVKGGELSALQRQYEREVKALSDKNSVLESQIGKQAQINQNLMLEYADVSEQLRQVQDQMAMYQMNNSSMYASSVFETTQNNHGDKSFRSERRVS